MVKNNVGYNNRQYDRGIERSKEMEKSKSIITYQSDLHENETTQGVDKN